MTLQLAPGVWWWSGPAHLWLRTPTQSVVLEDDDACIVADVLTGQGGDDEVEAVVELLGSLEAVGDADDSVDLHELAPGAVVACGAADPILRHKTDAPTLIVDEDRVWVVAGTGDAACPRCVALRLLAPMSPETHALVANVEAHADVRRGGRVPAGWRQLVARALDGLDEAPAWLVEGGTACTPVHPFVHPACDRCGGEARSQAPPAPPDLPAEPGPLDEEQLRRALDPRIGFVVGQVTPAPPEGRTTYEGLPFVWGGFQLVRPEGDCSQPGCAVGPGSSEAHKHVVCLSEALERYALRARQPDVLGASEAELGDRVVPDLEHLGYAADQLATAAFPFAAPNRDAAAAWVWARPLASGPARLLPYEAVADGATLPSAPRLARQVSTGAAAHVRWADACLGGLREVLERDQATIAWYKRLPLSRVRLDGIEEDAEALALHRFLREAGIDLDVFDLRLDVEAPCLLISATRQDDLGAWPAGGRVTLASCRPTALEALRQALWEVVVSYETQCLWPDEHKRPTADGYDPRDPAQGWETWWPLWLHYLHPANAHAFEWLLHSDRPEVSLQSFTPLAGETTAEHLAALVAVTQQAGLSPWVVDMTLPEISALGRVALRVVAPGALDVAFGRQAVRFGSPRLEAVAKRLARGGLPPGELNPDPHPAI